MLLKVAWLIVSYWFEQMNYTYKKIWLIAFPVMMSILIEQLINITDALFFHRSIIGAYTENPIIVQAAWLPFAVMLLNYFFALPGYVYLNAVTGTGATRTVFIFQVITTIAYLFCLSGLSRWNVPLAAYWAVEYLFVILLGVQSVFYLKYKQY